MAYMLIMSVQSQQQLHICFKYSDNAYINYTGSGKFGKLYRQAHSLTQFNYSAFQCLVKQITEY